MNRLPAIMVAMAAPLTDDERAHIVELIEAGEGRRAIAKAVKRDPATITRVAKSIGHDFLAAADERTQSSLTRAHVARSAFSAERRAEDAATAQERVREILATVWDKREQVVVEGKGGGVSRARKIKVQPSARDVESMAKAAEALERMVINVSKHDVKADEGGDQTMLVSFVDSLRAA